MWTKCLCFSQLNMTDSPDPEDCCLVRISHLPGLKWFTNIVFCCSYQDKYVSFDSARIQLSKQTLDTANRDPKQKQGQAYVQMARNILDELKSTIVYRLEVNFNILDK